MCGIAGFLLGKRRLEPAILGNIAMAMAQAIRHRGPDAHGVWIQADAGLAFGHTRLRVIDLSDAGAQPMVSPSERYVLNYNGELYNFVALRRMLIDLGQEFRGHSDTEVLLASIDTLGLEETLNRANGMFALALWDRAERRLSLARDRVGKKPLYYGWCGDTFLFASELRGLRAHPDFSATIDRPALSQFVRFGYISQPLSMYEGIRKLPPGGILAVEPRDVGSVREPRLYWSAKDIAEEGERAPFSGDYSEAVNALDSLLRDAVGQRMVADVDLGALLSGGVDSSTVVAIMQALGDRPVTTFSVGFHESRYNEAPHASQVARHLGTQHHEFYLAPDECLNILHDLPCIYDEPFADVSQIPTYLICRAARERVTVVLTGDGGDETFAGYRRYSEILDFWRRFGWMPARARAAVGASMAVTGRASWHLLAARRARRGAQVRGWRRVGSKWERDGQRLAAPTPRDLLALQLANTAPKAGLVVGTDWTPSTQERGSKWARVTDTLQSLMHADFAAYLTEDILVKLDRASMAVGLEARCPLLDARVAEFAFRLPTGMRLDRQGGKRVLRDVLARYVPPQLTARPKQGFSVPVAEWLRGPLCDWAEDCLDESRLRRQGWFNPSEVRRLWFQHRSGFRKHTKLIWAVLVLQRWCDEYL